jgi:rubrerythrin
MPASAIEFSTLTLRDALDLAILIDEEAEERYEELADQMEVHHTPEAASFFHRMSSTERQHASELRDRRQQLFRDQGCRVSRAMLWDVKAPEYDQVHAFMTLREAMQTALGAEEKAEAFFDAGLREIRDGEVAALFGELRREEARLHEQFEKDLAELPREREVSPDEYADEPVGL